MPKKLNFLGGQQNYDPKNGEYLPDLTNKDGESVKNFKSFKKSDEEKNAFNEYNNKRMGKDKPNLEKELGKAKNRVEKFMPNLPNKKAMVRKMDSLLVQFKSGNDKQGALQSVKDNIKAWQRMGELDTNSMRDDRLAYFEKIVEYMEENMSNDIPEPVEEPIETNEEIETEWFDKNYKPTEPGKIINYKPYMNYGNGKVGRGNVTKRAKTLNNGLAMETKGDTKEHIYFGYKGKYKVVDLQTGLMVGWANNYEDAMKMSNDQQFIDKINNAKEQHKQKKED